MTFPSKRKVKRNGAGRISSSQNGSVSVDQKSTIHGDFSKSTVLPIVTLLKCRSTWSCYSRWIVYSSNYCEGDNNQEYIEHASRWSHLRCNSCQIKFSYVVNQCSRYLAKTNKAHYEVLRQILSILLELHMMLTWCATQQHWRKVSNFSRFTHTPIRSGMMTGTLARVLVVRA